MAIGPPILDKKNDEELLFLVVQGQHPAFTELVNRHAKRYYQIAYRTVFNKNDAEDIVQEAFLKLWKAPQQWSKDQKTKFSTWFYRVVINLCLDYNKKKKPLPMEQEKISMVADTLMVDESLDAKQKQFLLKSWIQELPERQQMALNLCFFEGLSNKEAAEILEINIKALQSLLIRAKNSLKDKMRKHQLMDGQ